MTSNAKATSDEMTVGELRNFIREEVLEESFNSKYVAKKPLRKDTLLQAYKSLFGDEIDNEASIGEIRYKLANKVGLPLKPYDAARPFRKDELQVISNELREWGA